MRRKQAVAVMHHVVKALEIVKDMNENYDEFRECLRDQEDSDAEDYLWYYEYQHDVYRLLLNHALEFFDIREEEIPSYSRLLTDLHVKDISRSIIKKAAFTLADAMSLNEAKHDINIIFG